MFIDRDDILYSLRYGSHLRRVINTVLPDCFDLSPNRFENPTRSTRTVLQNAGLNEDIIEKYIEDEDWISQFLLICWKRLLIPPERLFHANDLIGNDDLSQPYKSFITKCASTSTWKLEFDQNERIRRVRSCFISHIFVFISVSLLKRTFC
ncbi:hypothetical protein AB6A40_003558 [Gnathostoma spinigerum]|uniref:Uncharacterized protein n=1 Tax=Gnathostoma spinigerum TaxID=75299 RepID=A0ABD6EHN6_9BILA